MPIMDFFNAIGQGGRTGNFGIGSQVRGGGTVQLPAAAGSGVVPRSGGTSTTPRPSNMPDFDWFFWQETAAANGMTGTTSAAGNPNTYTYTGDTVTLDRGRGRPYVVTGAATSLTVINGGQLVGSMSYGGDCNCHIAGFLRDPMRAIMNTNGGVHIPMTEGETLTGNTDNANTNEQRTMAACVSFGSYGHKYPESIEEVLKLGGLNPKEIWTPIVTVTPSVTLTSGGNSLATGATGTRWIDGESKYYIVGAQAHGLASSASGFLVFAGGLPDYLKMRNNVIPFGGVGAAGGEGPKISYPYYPIGPFTSANYPILNALGTVAAATLQKLYIAKM